jgi:hypothetical protein
MPTKKKPTKLSDFKLNNYSSNLFVSKGINSPVNANNSIDFYLTITFGLGNYQCRKVLSYDILIIEIQHLLCYYGNKIHNIIIELDRKPLKVKLIKEVIYKNDDFKFYFVTFCEAVPNQPILLNDLNAMLTTLKDVLTSSIKRYDYIVISNMKFNGSLTTENGVLTIP